MFEVFQSTPISEYRKMFGVRRLDEILCQSGLGRLSEVVTMKVGGKVDYTSANTRLCAEWRQNTDLTGTGHGTGQFDIALQQAG